MGLRVAILLASITAFAPTQAGPTLASLTVPERSLPAGCQLEPIPQDAASNTESARVRYAMGRPVFPVNPWSGTDRNFFLTLRTMIDGPLTVPDAPAPTRADISAMQQRYIADIREGYYATYRAGESLIKVAALNFSDAHTPRSDSRLDVAMSSRASERIVKGHRIVVVDSEKRSDCFATIVEHVKK